MKLLRLLIPILSVTFTAIAVSSKEPPPNNWLEITQSPRGDRFLVDLNSLSPNTKGKNRKINFQVQVQYKVPAKDGTTKAIATFRADCLSEELTRLESTRYNRSNQILDTDLKDVTLPVEPDSMWEALYNYGCKQLPQENANR